MPQQQGPRERAEAFCRRFGLRVYPVGPAVGNVRNDEPGLLEPVGAGLQTGDLLPV